MEWFRWYGGTFNDPKLQWIASKSCQTVASVLAVWVTVLERAHDHETRGCCEGLDFESLDVSLGLEDGATHDIYQAMIRKAMISDGDMVANWEKRQPKSEDIGAAERKRAQREREKLHNEIEELKKQLTVTQSQNVTPVTECHGMSRDVTTEESRLEEKREEKPLKPKDSSTTFLEEEVTGNGKPSSSQKMGLSEFREAFYKATGNLLPGGLNSQALEFCQHNPRDKLQEFFNIMASQGGRTFKYFREIVKGKPKAVVERKSKSQERQDGAIAAAQETIRVLQERRYGSEVRGKAGGSIDGVDCYPGHTSIDNGAAIVVPPCLG